MRLRWWTRRGLAEFAAGLHPETSPQSRDEPTASPIERTGTMRSTVTAVVEHDPGTDPADMLTRYVGQNLGYYGSTVRLTEVTGVEAIDEPDTAADSGSVVSVLRELLAEQRATREYLEAHL